MRFDRKDVFMMMCAAAAFVWVLIFTRDTTPEPEPVPEPKPYVTVSEQFMKDVQKLPDPKELEEETTEEVDYWRNEETFEPSDLIPLSAEDQIQLYHICRVQNVPMPYALAIIHSESYFNAEAVGSCGEVGVFQINPVNWYRFEQKGIDVHTMTGNLEAGVMMLREALDAYMEMDNATMVYKCGLGRATELINEGVRLEVCDEVSSLAMYYEEILCGSEEY
jgi:hypothetical protein